MFFNAELKETVKRQSLCYNLEEVNHFKNVFASVLWTEFPFFSEFFFNCLWTGTLSRFSFF